MKPKLFKRMNAAAKDESGQTVVLTALSMVALIGAMGLCIDAGNMFQIDRKMQVAADSGAIGAAAEILRGNSAGVTSSAKSMARLNGFADGSQGVTVTVNSPPQGGYYAGQTGYVEVIVHQSVPVSFMAVMGYKTVSISARGVAGIIGSKSCIYLLNPKMTDALYVDSALVTAGCGITVNSNAKEAVRLNGSCKVTVSRIAIDGGYYDPDCPPNGKIVTGVPPSADPVATLQAPSAVGLTHLTCCSQNFNGTLNPGIYDGGINLDQAHVTLNPGIYILYGGGLQEHQSVVSGTGVAFYNTCKNGNCAANPSSFGTWYTDGTGLMNVSPPTSGSMAGVLFFEDRSAPSGKTNWFGVSGGGTNTIHGTIYMPVNGLHFDSNTAAGFDQIAVNWLSVGGSSSVTMNGTFGGSGTGGLTRFALVE